MLGEWRLRRLRRERRCVTPAMRRELLALVCVALQSGCADGDCTLTLFIDASCIGAEWFANGEPQGRIERGAGDGAIVGLGVPWGSNVIEVRRPGHPPVVQTIEIPKGASEHYGFLDCPVRPAEPGDVSPFEGRSS